ncbi:hypothetical protein B5807_04735 [Epicoccum nigrum]|uniref:Ribosomal protein/NADH dehydrogenase domain-containing protein n=1 Tax=Epicoccum nigrum TaxID=105696 RepID=A0A1Y2M372_EPING|nr:hypothetical protein B5807_04735 [Epicoccum nigrum]
MVNILARSRHLQKKLLWIRCGPGAVVLPKEVSKISMEFNTKLYGGHRGARKFWREMLPRIKYRNPSIPIEINRHNTPEGPSLLHVWTKAQPNTPDGSSNTSIPSLHTASATAATPPSSTPNARNTQVPDATKPTYTIDIRDQHQGEILDALLAKLPESEVVRPTPEEEQAMADHAEQDLRSEADRVLVKERLTKERREAELLRLARGEVADAQA